MSDLTIGRLRGGFCVIWYDADGRRRRHQLEARDRKEAEREAIDVYRRATLRPGNLTVGDLWEAYREDRQGRAIVETMRHQAKAVGPHWFHLRPDQVETRHSRAYTRARREAGIKDGTIWSELSSLRIVLNWAVSEKLIASAPKIERPPKPAPKDRWLTHAEIDRLLAAPMAPHVRIAILLMLSTACRPAAALDLTWDRVDFELGQIDLRIDSTGPRKGRAVVAMNAGLRAALSEARRGALTEYVVEWSGKPVKSIKTAFRKTVKAAELEDVTPYVLRHTAAVHLAAAGVPMQKISQVMGHSNTAVTERVYARYSPDHMREEVAILDFTKLRVAGGEGG